MVGKERKKTFQFVLFLVSVLCACSTIEHAQETSNSLNSFYFFTASDRTSPTSSLFDSADTATCYNCSNESANYQSSSEEMDSFEASNECVVKITTFNIGHFSNGQSSCPTGIYQDIKDFENEFNKIDADIIALNENSMFFDADETIISQDIYYSFSNYLCGASLGFDCNALLSNYNISSFTQTLFHNSSTRYFIDASLNIGTFNVHFIVTHLEWKDIETRSEQIIELIDAARSYERFVICGDMNPSSSINGIAGDDPLSQYQIDYGKYSDIGFKLANCGAFGSFNTLVQWEGIDIYPWDNIIVSSNIEIVSVERNNVVLSDHYPITATIKIN